jgi:SAM-dependent methyltransferase
MADASSLPLLYTELAGWFHLLTAPQEYAEEADFYRRVLVERSARPIRTVLELGSGGGNNASHMKRHFELTLADLSPAMLAISRSLNPECEHVEGDMRTLRLGRRFDAVFVHDAVSYLIEEADVRAAAHTAFEHCEPGGVALFVPDAITETFEPKTGHGGHDGPDGDQRALRYLEWFWDPSPEDTWYVSDMVYLLRDGEDVRVVHDRHVCGLFPRTTWLAALRGAGFEPIVLPAEFEDGGDVFVGKRPAGTP